MFTVIFFFNFPTFKRFSNQLFIKTSCLLNIVKHSVPTPDYYSPNPTFIKHLRIQEFRAKNKLQIIHVLAFFMSDMFLL